MLAILNSRVASFFTHMYRLSQGTSSHSSISPFQLLRKEQEEVVRMVNLLLSNEANVGGLYDELDKYIMSLYKLGSRKGYCRTLYGWEKLFLPLKVAEKVIQIFICSH